jgi:TatA/E family protein of Tat protein translocase
MGGWSLSHWAVVLIIALIVFGPKKLPELAQSLGKALREFKKAQSEMAESFHRELHGHDDSWDQVPAAPVAVAEPLADPSPAPPEAGEADAPYGGELRPAAPPAPATPPPPGAGSETTSRG